MNNSTLPYWLTFAVLLAGLYGGFKWYQVERAQSAGGVELSEISLPPLEEFELTTSDGKPFRSADMKGKVWVATFFFSTCTGSCSRLNSNIKHLSSLPETEGVTWVSITVDPQTDTEAALARYAKRFNADPQRWIFCRHDDFEYIKRLADDVLHVGATYKGHADHAVIVDKHGKIVGMFNATSTSQSKRGVETLKKCLAEKYEPREPASAGGNAVARAEAA
ncbi:MAG TPA: SCO family protein [Lacipirellula sp.]